ncbi:10677_t:CDS:2, partial [Cetraspora pellucida]
MEYNIYSSNSSTNKIIIAALEDLNNTFFVEHLDSESDKESNSLSDVELISDIDDDIFLSKLNEFNFVDVEDSYIEDKIYDELKLNIQIFFEKGKCSYHSELPCFIKIGYEKFLARQAEFESLDKNMRDMVIKGQFIAFQKICHNTYLALVGISHKYLENLKWHLQEHGLEERIHSNTGRASNNMKRIEVNYNVTYDLFKFLKNYSNIHAYKNNYEKDVRVMSETTFIKIWKILILSLQFMSPKSDLYETCKTLKMDIQQAMQYEKKLELTNNYIAHLNRAQKERDHYNNNIKNVVKDEKCNSNKVSSQQIGHLYFKNWQKMHLFGVCNTGNFPHTQQTNYVIDEAEMPNDINTVDDVVSIINHSTLIDFNIAQHYLNGEGFQYYNFKNYFEAFKKLPNIQKYHHFYFNSQNPGVVFYKNDLDNDYKNFTIRSFSFNTNTLLSTIEVSPLSLKRQEELYKEIAPYIDLPFHDITCSKPE